MPYSLCPNCFYSNANLQFEDCPKCGIAISKFFEQETIEEGMPTAESFVDKEQDDPIKKDLNDKMPGPSISDDQHSKFVLNQDEQLVMKGNINSFRNRTDTGRWERVIRGNAYLTSKRFVYCKGSPTKLLFAVLFSGIFNLLDLNGLIGAIFGYCIASLIIKSKSIVFEFPLVKLKSIHLEKQGLFEKLLILTLQDGSAYAFHFIITGSSLNKWLDAVKNAAKRFVPNI